MKKSLFTSLAICSMLYSSYFKAQNVGINATNTNPDASAMLDVNSTSKGLLIPRVTLTGTTDVTTIATAATSLLVYNTATVSDVTPGYYYWDGTVWLRMINTGNASGGDWALTGNAGTTVGTNFLGTTDVQDFAIYTNNTEQIRVTSAGNVGIGTAIPSAKAHVNLTSNTTSTHILGITRQGTGAAGNGVFFTHGASLSDYNAITDVGDIGMFFDIDGNPAVSTSTNGLVIAPWANGGTPGQGSGIKIQENGNVGISVSNPAARLDVFRSAISNNPALNVVKDFNGVANDHTAFIGGVDIGFTNTGLYVLQKDNVSFASTNTYILNAVINSTSQMVMNGYGNVRIGGDTYSNQCNATAIAEANNVKLAVWGGYTAIGSVNNDPGIGGVAPTTEWLEGVGSLVIGKNRSGGTANVDFWNNADPANGLAALSVAHRGFNWRNFQNSGGCAESLLMTLDGNGNLTLNRYNVGGGQVSAYAFNTISDKRIKTKIETLSDDIVGKLMQLQPKSYNLIDVDYDPTVKLEFNSSKVLEKQYGFIAQEVYEVFPEFVHKPIDETKELWTVDYSKFVSVLVKTTQIQQNDIEQLKKENEQIRKELEEIKRLIVASKK